MTEFTDVLNLTKQIIDRQILTVQQLYEANDVAFLTSFDKYCLPPIDFMVRNYPGSRVIFIDTGSHSDDTYRRADYIIDMFYSLKFDIISSHKTLSWLSVVYEEIKRSNRKDAIKYMEEETLLLPLNEYIKDHNIGTIFSLILNIGSNKHEVKSELYETHGEFLEDFCLWKHYPFLHWSDEDYLTYQNEFGFNNRRRNGSLFNSLLFV